MTHGITEDLERLVGHLKANFALDWYGVHGISHWLRVRDHALIISRHVACDRDILELFALLHDSRRLDEEIDPWHGERAAQFTAHLNGSFFTLSTERLETLVTAIRFHSRAGMSSNPTIQTCWDADRLDLGRVGIAPKPNYLSPTAQAFLHHGLRPKVLKT